MNILDLDDISTWDESFNKFIKNDSFWPVIENALSHEADDKVVEILNERNTKTEYVKPRELLLFFQRCSEHLKEIYTHVAAYHSCRPTDIKTYLSKGIIPSNTEELIEIAKILFNDADAVTEAVKDLKQFHPPTLNFNHGNICFFISQTGAQPKIHRLKVGKVVLLIFKNILTFYVRPTSKILIKQTDFCITTFFTRTSPDNCFFHYLFTIIILP